jgi:hypothetical protein
LKNMITGHVLAALILTIALPIPVTTAQTSSFKQGFSPLNPAPIGMQLETVIECGFGYRPHEKYNVKVTLLEAVRGDKAWQRIKAVSASNQPPQRGFEYILARIKFEYSARGAPGDCIHELRSEEFTAFSGKGIEYENPLVVPPQPELNAKLRSGESFEGWLVFQTSPSEDTALLRFMASVGRAVEQGGQIWFRLY